MRTPLSASVHVMYSLDSAWLAFVRGGIARDFKIDLSVNGTTALPFEGRAGFVGDLGVIYAFDDVWNISVSLRLTKMSYALADARVDAGSFGVVGSIDYDLY